MINRCRYTDVETYRALFRDVSGEKAVGEASTLYLYSEKAPERIYHRVPEAKLITVLRNPVERAYSAFWFMVRDSREPLTDFGRALAEEDGRIVANWGPEYHYRRRGFYHSQLERYFERFGRDQVRVYLYDDLKSDPTGVARDIFRFLEVDESFAPDMSREHNVSGVPKSKMLQPLYLFLRKSNPLKSALKPLLPAKLRHRLHARAIESVQSRNLARPPGMSPELRRELVETYREDILRLQDLIQRDLSGWLE